MENVERRLRLLATTAGVLSVLVALAAAGGIWMPSVYARETASWRAQGIGQDWVDLVVVAPLLALCALGMRRSHALQLVFGGALAYLIYSFVLYAFAMHFNAQFLVYCAVLGVSFYALLGLGWHLSRTHEPWVVGRLRLAVAGGWFLIATGVAFYALWLSSVIPALISGEPPPELAEVGLITNPVHVLDLALVLPAMVLGGAILRRRGPLAVVIGASAMAFNALMSLALVGMMVSMNARGLSESAGVTVMIAVLCAISCTFLVAYLRQLRTAAQHENALPA